MGKRLSEESLHALAGASRGVSMAERVMATELLELRAFRDAVLAWARADDSSGEGWVNANWTAMTAALATERARMEGNDAG